MAQYKKEEKKVESFVINFFLVPILKLIIHLFRPLSGLNTIDNIEKNYILS